MGWKGHQTILVAIFAEITRAGRVARSIGTSDLFTTRPVECRKFEITAKISIRGERLLRGSDNSITGEWHVTFLHNGLFEERSGVEEVEELLLIQN